MRSEKVNLATSTLLDRETWGLDTGGNWLSYTRTSDNLMQTRSIDNMNRLQQTGGAGTTVIEGGINEMADVTVNSQPAELRSDPATGGYRYKRAVAVTTGTNTVNVTAVDKDDPPNTVSQNWEFTVPGVQRSFTYDANGNTLTDGQRTFTWDAKNRLKTVTKSGTTYEWDYDYQDRRVREYQYAAGGSKPSIPTWQYLWRDTELVQERTGTSATAGTVKRSHVFGGFEDRSVSGGTTIKKNYLTTRDHLGHTREVIVGNTAAGTVGTLLARYDYSPYQGPSKVYGTTVDASLLTIGRYYHHAGSGLELALYRAYDPELGRWMSEDPLEDAELKEGPNLYGFVQGRVCMLRDLDGLRAAGPINPIPSFTSRSKCLEYWDEWERQCKLLGRCMLFGLAGAGPYAGEKPPFKGSPKGKGILGLCIGAWAWLWSDHIDECAKRAKARRDACPAA